MSLKELTAQKHKQAESTKFMQAVFAKTLPQELWIDWTYQKCLFYHTLEGMAGSYRLLSDLPDLRRGFKLWQDYDIMEKQFNYVAKHKKSVLQYQAYILQLNSADKVMAHIYTWHMGDLFGGQMIRKIVGGSHKSLDFADPKLLLENIRNKVNDDMAAEANCAFDWAIKMLEEYDSSLG